MASDLGLLSSAVNQVSSLQAQAVENQAGAAASGVTASGDLVESNAYGTAKQLAERNATLEGISGDIVAIQEQRAANRTVGQQQASVAAAGFASSGSSLDILKSSLQQSYLTQQMNRVQTQINVGGFLEAGVASETERAAAERASQAALTLQQQQATAGERATANAAAETAAIENFVAVQSKKSPLSPLDKAKQDVVTSTLRNTDGSPVQLPSSVGTATTQAGLEDTAAAGGGEPAGLASAAGFHDPALSGIGRVASLGQRTPVNFVVQG